MIERALERPDELLVVLGHRDVVGVVAEGVLELVGHEPQRGEAGGDEARRDDRPVRARPQAKGGSTQQLE